MGNSGGSRSGYHLLKGLSHQNIHMPPTSTLSPHVGPLTNRESTGRSPVTDHCFICSNLSTVDTIVHFLLHVYHLRLSCSSWIQFLRVKNVLNPFKILKQSLHTATFPPTKSSERSVLKHVKLQTSLQCNHSSQFINHFPP